MVMKGWQYNCPGLADQVTMFWAIIISITNKCNKTDYAHQLVPMFSNAFCMDWRCHEIRNSFWHYAQQKDKLTKQYVYKVNRDLSKSPHNYWWFKTLWAYFICSFCSGIQMAQTVCSSRSLCLYMMTLN